jgi:hypothetical protein
MMKKNFAILAALALSMTPALGQVITPHLTPPPCTGHHCLEHPRGAMMPGVDPAHKAPCPPGTVYNPQRGTCKVLPTAQH